MESLNYYEILGVRPDSTESDIKKAYYRIARLHHPDRAGDGDVEVFKRATLAYEILSNLQERRQYDDTQAAKDGKPHWSSPSRDSAAAAAAAFRTTATATTTTNAETDDTRFTEERTYRRRPQQTRFSKTTQNFKSRDHAGPTAWQASASSTSTSRGKKRPMPHPDIVDLTGDEEESDDDTANAFRDRSFSETSPPPSPLLRTEDWSTAADPGFSKKRKSSSSRRGDSQENNGTPRKKSRVFDFSDIRNVPPFTQKHGTSFSFSAVNDAINESILNLGGSARLRQYNRASRSNEYENMKKIERQWLRNQHLLRQYTTESQAGFDDLFKMHNQRVQLMNQSMTNKQTVLENFQATAQVLEVLLAGTKDCIDKLM